MPESTGPRRILGEEGTPVLPLCIESEKGSGGHLLFQFMGYI